MVSWPRDARNALAFLSRLIPPASPPGGEHGACAIAASVPFFPPAGFLLGILAAFPAFLPCPAPLAAWAYILLLAWMTRGFHWDGLADLADACGSNAAGDRFWDIIKDSRIGAFGVMALVFGIAGQVIAATACLQKGFWMPLIIAPAFGRAMIIPFGRTVRPHPRSTLAALIQPGVESAPASASFAVALAASVLCLGFPVSLAASLLAGTVIFILRRIALAHGGTNGDFHGALIIAAETAILASGSFS